MLLMTRDKPWIFRTYAGHSSAAASNALYRTNLAKGQTGLSVAFDLPTQTGYDSDDALAKGEVGKVGVPVCHLGDMRDAVRRHAARQHEHLDDDQRAGGVAARAVCRAWPTNRARRAPALTGTTQNDIIKEYLARGTYIFPPAPALRLTTDTIAFTTARNAEMESDQSVLLSSAGSRRRCGGGSGLRARRGRLRARCRARRAAQFRRRNFPRPSAACASSSIPA